MSGERFIHRLPQFARPALPGLAVGLAWLLAGCQANQSASYTAPQSSSTGAFGYSNTAPYTPVSSQPGTVTATQPIPIALTGTAPPSPNQPNITAKAAILVDGYGRVLFEKNADSRLPAASTQKLLLGLLVAERGDLSRPVTVVESDTWAEPTIMGIKPGEVYTREELLKAVLIRSSNDIARTLGRDHSGSESAFVAQMNLRARQMGMTNSYFTNSNGLPSPPGQYSTARDLAKLGLASLRNPKVADAVRTQTYTFRMANGTTRTLNNTNQVLKHFPQCTGLKTGFTNAAGRCLVSSASANGKTVVAVILGSSTPTVWQESEMLLKYGLGM